MIYENINNMKSDIENIREICNDYEKYIRIAITIIDNIIDIDNKIIVTKLLHKLCTNDIFYFAPEATNIKFNNYINAIINRYLPYNEKKHILSLLRGKNNSNDKI